MEAQALNSRCLSSLGFQSPAAPLLWDAYDSPVPRVQQRGGGLPGRCADCELQLILGSSCYDTPCVAKTITAARQQIVAREAPRTAARAIINNSSGDSALPAHTFA